MNIRIVKRIYPDGNIKYVIQQRHFLFRWIWVDAWINSLSGAACKDTFNSLEEAKKHLCYFDDSKPIDEVINT